MHGLARRSAVVSIAACLFSFPAVSGALAGEDGSTRVPPTARYTLRFAATWSRATHPPSLTPPSPHFSGLVGGVHDERVSFWDVGQRASAGIERMAELGSKTPLDAEVSRAIDAGTAEAVISGGGINPSPGSVSVSFTASLEYHLVTVVSMIAPSPDWFVGVSGLDLLADGAWIDEVVVELFAYDAGTDDGEFWNSPDAEPAVHQPITRIVSSAFPSGRRLGTFTFTREIPPVEPVRFLRGDCNGDGVLDISDVVAMLLRQFGSGVDAPCLAACDANGDGALSAISDAVTLLNRFFAGGPPLPEPSAGCGESRDPRDVALGCEESSAGCE